MTPAMILAPTFLLVALSFVLLFRLGPMRLGAVSRGEVGREGLLDPNAFPESCRQVSNAFSNQFQLPVLFYVLTILALVTRKADILFVILAWVFVASRYVHAFVHVTSNDIKLRFPAYAIGALVLAVMWALFAIAILFNI
ncbi:MAG: MAPEG family protein [Pseudomonadota bacterium]